MSIRRKTIDDITRTKSTITGSERLPGRDNSGDFKTLISSIYNYFKNLIISTDTTLSGNSNNVTPSQKAAKTYIDNQIIAFMYAPIGSIIGWHKAGPGGIPSPALPDKWVECNGQKLKGNQYLGSPFYNKIIPNLNIGNGNGRYLRGTTGKSGIFQNATLHPYIFPAGLNQLKYPNSHLPIRNPDSKKCNQENSRMIFFSIKGPELEKAQTYYYSSRPISMTVVWIIKVTH